MNDDWIDRWEYPFDSHYLEVPAGRLHYIDEGSGDPVVMLHGNPTWSFLYRRLIKTLRPQYRCIALDHIGFGLSSKPQDWPYDAESHTRNLTALIDTLQLKNITLVLQDWGGPIGMAYAVEYPENVARIVVMNTWAWPVSRDLHFRGFSTAMGGLVGRTLIRRFNLFARALLPLGFGNKEKLSGTAHEHYLRPLQHPQDRRGCEAFPKRIIADTPWLKRVWSRRSVLRGKPTLIIWGMKDMAFRSKELHRWQSAFPEAEVVRLESVGHFVPEEAPRAVAAAVGPFLSGMSSP